MDWPKTFVIRHQEHSVTFCFAYFSQIIFQKKMANTLINNVLSSKEKEKEGAHADGSSGCQKEEI